MKKRSFRIFSSLSSKLSFGILGVVISVFVVSITFLYVRSRQIVRQEAGQRTSRMLENTSMRLIGYMKEAEVATENISWLAVAYPQPDSLYNYTRRVVELNPNINGCSITMEPGYFPDMDHNFSVYTIREGDLIETEVEKAYNYYDKAWYKTPRRLGKACWIPPYNDFNEGTLSSPFMIASYSKPLFNADMKLIGVISTDISIQKITDAILAVKPTPHSYGILLGPDGRYYVHADRSKVIKQTIFTAFDEQSHPDIVQLGKEMTSGNKGIKHIKLDHDNYVVFYQSVQGTDWSIGLVCRENDIYDIFQKPTFILIPLLISGLILMFLFCWFTVKHFIKPFHYLVEKAQNISRGHFDTVIERSNRKDDIGKLQNSFAATLKAINERIDDIQHINNETEKRNADLAKANRLEEEAEQRKNRSIQEASRNIRTPLNIISGFMQILALDASSMSKDEMTDSIDAMKQKAIAIRRMAHMLYDASRTENYPLDLTQLVDVNIVIQESIKNFHEIAPSNAILEYQSDLPTPHMIHTNQLYLHRTLRELLINAKKFASEKPINLTVEHDDTHIRFYITDHGKGIPEDDRERIFAPFYKMDIYTEGFGIGLGLSRQHAKDLMGTLILNPDYTDGAQFILEIPNQ